MKAQAGDKERLNHILFAINEIESYTLGADFTVFINISMMRFACIKQVEIIGEAANSLSKQLKSKHNFIEWRKIIAMRHILVHDYFGIDNMLLWQIIIKDIPELKVQIEKIITEMG